MRAVFEQYAKVTKDGEKYMRLEDFATEFLEIGNGEDGQVNIETAKMLGGILDSSKDG